MLTLEGVTIAQGAFALSANWTIAKGSTVAIIGPSGAGKSTLLLAIAGFITPMAGRMLWDGHDMQPLLPGNRPLSLLFQDQNLFPHLTIAQNLGLGLSPSLNLTKDQKAQIDTALARVGLSDMATRKPGTLSGGQQGRAALARALLRARPMLLLDEPFAALGPALKAEMLDLVREVVQESGATLLMVTHDPADARRIADQTILVADGIAQAPHRTADLFSAPPPALRDYLGR